MTTMQSMVVEGPERGLFWKVDTMKMPIKGKNHHGFLTTSIMSSLEPILKLAQITYRV